MALTKFIQYILLLSILAVLSSCEKVIDMDINGKPPKLVINAWLEPDSLVKVHLSHSIHILDKEEIQIVENGKILLFENNIQIDSLRYIGRGLYSNSSIRPKMGNTYRIEASAPDYPSAFAETIIPDTISIKNLKIENSVAGNLSKTVSFNFNDPSEVENYYMVYLKIVTTPLVDTIKNWQNNYLLNFNIDNPIIELSGYNLLDEFYPIDQSSFNFGNNNEINADVIAFSDQSINGQKNIQIKLNTNYYYYDDTSVKHKTNLYLVSISKDYYQYIRTISAQNDDPFTERTHVRTNVTNGYGILLSSNKSSRPIQLD